ncbi:MAG: type II toxin-antitoxin system VapC family toxin [Micropruina sp.]|uniref:type II toxin-antitoxin system VapC family toxin n=1 Tax=Micropruina sp. TaxID=2737536 RepID=UPI0039E250C2
MFVVDASVTMAWCFEDEATEATDAVLDRLGSERARVPAIWPLEVANVLLVAQRRGRVSEAQVSRFVRLLAQLPIDVDDTGTDLVGLLALGRTHQLSSDDASYLLLAERTGLPLATLDERLSRAATSAGVPLLIPAL